MSLAIIKHLVDIAEEYKLRAENASMNVSRMASSLADAREKAERDNDLIHDLRQSVNEALADVEKLRKQIPTEPLRFRQIQAIKEIRAQYERNYANESGNFIPGLKDTKDLTDPMRKFAENPTEYNALAMMQAMREFLSSHSPR